MKKDVYISIKGLQELDGEKDNIEITTEGRFYNKDGKEVFCRRFDTSNISGYRPMRLNEFQETCGNNTEIKYFNY